MFTWTAQRRYVLPFFKKFSPSLVGNEACATSHHWSRELQAFGVLRGVTAEIAKLRPHSGRRRERLEPPRVTELQWRSGCISVPKPIFGRTSSSWAALS